MATIYDVDANELIEKAGSELKKQSLIQPPEWAPFVKTGTQKVRPPLNNDWFYVRTAAVLRKIYRYGPIGVAKLRGYYGGLKHRGVQPEKFKKGSGSVLRKALQQLEKAGLAKQVEKGLHKGRIITPKGKSFLDKIATQIQKSAPTKEIKAEAKKHEEAPQKDE